jgi:hypothetical protein
VVPLIEKRRERREKKVATVPSEHGSLRLRPVHLVLFTLFLLALQACAAVGPVTPASNSKAVVVPTSEPTGGPQPPGKVTPQTERGTSDDNRGTSTRTPPEVVPPITSIPVLATPSEGVDAPRSPNKYGVHLLLDDGVNEWPEAVWPQHVQAAHQLVGDGGYVVQLIRSDDLDLRRWQLFMDLCARAGLVPIIRLATFVDRANGWWVAPEPDADGRRYTTIARRYAEFLAQLRWPDGPRYVLVHNEPNRGDEWSNRPNPREYGQYLIDVSQALRPLGMTILAPGLDLYAPHTNGGLVGQFRYIDAETFIDEMASAHPTVFDAIDIWAAHAYPPDPFRLDPSRQVFKIDYLNGAHNPRHMVPPAGLFNRGVNSYQWEMWKIRQYFGEERKIPVMITETGWRHRETQDPRAEDHVGAEIPEHVLGHYATMAFQGNRGRFPKQPETGWLPWDDDPTVVGAVLFALGGFPSRWGHTNWVIVADDGRITGTYPMFDNVRHCRLRLTECASRAR